jgi:transcriptional regulator with XRE-family HTH domain
MALSNNILLVDTSTPADIILGVAARVRARRLELGLTQAALASRAGISLGSYRRFETSGEISFRSLTAIAIALRSSDDFNGLFSGHKYASIEDVISGGSTKKRKRGRVTK